MESQQCWYLLVLVAYSLKPVKHFYCSVIGEALRNNVAPVCMEPRLHGTTPENVCARLLYQNASLL